MGKLIGGLALGLILCAGEAAQGQDPFAVPNLEPQAEEAPPLYLEAPPDQTEEPAPIIETVPVEKAEKPAPRTSQRPRVRRTPRTQKRSVRTPAEEYIYQRAVYRAKQRTTRIEQRKWRGESLLRPSNSPDYAWWYETRLPMWNAPSAR